MTMRRLLIALGCFAILTGLVSGGRVRAQAEETDESDEGYNHFDRGVEYVQDGDLRGALIEFKRAYLASPNYRVLYNLGQVCNELREYTDAQRYFQSYLSDGGEEIPPARRREVEATLVKLSGRVATLDLSCNIDGAELFVDDVSVGHTPLSEPLKVSAGARRVTAATSGGRRVTQVVEAAGGDTLPVRLDFPPNTGELNHAAPASLPSASRPSDGPGPVLWLGIGTGALAVGAGVMAYLAARDAADYHDALHRKTTVRELDDLDNRATTKALVTDVLLGATVVAAATTLVFALRGENRQESKPNHADRVSARLTVGVGTLSVSGGFE